MSILNAPAGGMVKQLADVVEGSEPVGMGVAIVPLAERTAAEPTSAVVAPVAGVLQDVSVTGFSVVPSQVSPPLPTAKLVLVRIVGGDESGRKVLADAGDEVAPGEEIIRWKTKADSCPSFVLEVVDPDGEVLCDRMNAEIYAAEPLLEILGPAAEELSPVVSLEPGGTVTPGDPDEASQLAGQGEQPGQARP